MRVAGTRLARAGDGDINLADSCLRNASNLLRAASLKLTRAAIDVLEPVLPSQHEDPATMTTREELVLAHRDPTIEDENDWEEFILKDVKIYHQGKSRLATLLLATEEAPVCVTGLLQRLDEDQEHLGKPVTSQATTSQWLICVVAVGQHDPKKRIQLDHVTHFAYGQDEQGDVEIWAAGKAGWFEIVPSPRYEAIYAEMVEAIDLLYFLADNYRRPGGKKRRNWNPKLKYLFEEYVEHTHGRCADVEEAAEVFYKHHTFLITQMLEGREGVQWALTLLCEHFAEKYPDEYEEIKGRLDNKDKPDSDEVDSFDAASAEDTESSDSVDTSEEQAGIIYEVIMDMKDSGWLQRRALNMRTLAEYLHSRYDIGTVEDARGIISNRANLLLSRLKSAEDMDWTRRTLYKELRTAIEEDTTSLDQLALRLRLPTDLNSFSDEDESVPQIPTPVRGRRGRNRKSVLRLAHANKSGKAAGKRGRKAIIEDNDAEDGEDPPETPITPSGIDTPSKSKGRQLIRDPLGQKTNGVPRSISNSRPPESPERSLSPPSSPDPSSQLQMPPPPLPNGTTGDTWTCSVPGCGRTVAKMHSKRGKELIDDHGLFHAEDTQTKIDLVKTEMRFDRPVGNLVQRIQALGALEALGDLGSLLGIESKKEVDDAPSPPKKIRR